MSKRDYYEVLGVNKNSTENDIKRAYRKLAKKYHPDIEGGNEEKFKEATEAYEILSDSTKRSKYDRFGHMGTNSSNAGFEDIFSGARNSNSSNFGGFKDIFGDIFGDIFSGNSRQQNRKKHPIDGQDISLRISLSLKKYMFGCEITKNIKLLHKCDNCFGTGSEKKQKGIKKCATCKGYGIINIQQRTPFGMIQTQRTCHTCKGQGEEIIDKCKKCNADGYLFKKTEIIFNVPPSLSKDENLVIKGKGNSGINGGSNGNIYIQIEVEKDNEYEILNNKDLKVHLPVSYIDLLLGASIKIPTFDGYKTIKISPNTNNNEKIIISDCGLFYNKRHRGNLIVILVAKMPKKITIEERKLLNKIRENSKINIDYSKYER